MNEFDGKQIARQNFAYRDLLNLDSWEKFTPIFGSITLVGTPTYTGRLRFVGAQLQFQVKIVPGTSIATVAGTDYMTLPSAAKGLSGIAVMTNDTTNVAVGLCHIDVATGRCYLPAQAASGNTFTICGGYEV